MLMMNLSVRIMLEKKIMMSQYKYTRENRMNKLQHLTSPISPKRRPVTKTRVSFAINKNLYDKFKTAADKDMRKYSNIVESSLNRYVQSKS